MFGIDTLFYIAMALSAVTSFVGAQQSADAAEDAGKAQQEAAAQQARNEELQTAEEISRERVNKRRRLARLRADLGQTGLAMGGSLADSFSETAGTMELALQDKTRAGNMEAQNLRSHGDMALWEARNQAIGTRISSYGSLLTGLTGTARA
ncbi:MAG: hypothetical protein EOP88_20940 [Verrucomicrobiaceae bacterium]|nr:MAG: hypothetical protein EOP88_20940 [Verrucomicrobiaceae bacterium]